MTGMNISRKSTTETERVVVRAFPCTNLWVCLAYSVQCTVCRFARHHGVVMADGVVAENCDCRSVVEYGRVLP